MTVGFTDSPKRRLQRHLHLFILLEGGDNQYKPVFIVSWGALLI